MARKRSPPWGVQLGDGKPIERLFPRDDPQQREAADRDAQAELDRRLARLAQHYGSKTFRELALALGRKRDPALTIIDPWPQPTHKTAKRWASGEGVQFLRELSAIRDAAGNENMTIDELLERHRLELSRYRDMDFDTLRSRYSDSVKYHPIEAARLGFKGRRTKSLGKRSKCATKPRSK